MRPISVGLDPSLGDWAPEIKYTLRTLLRVAGYPCEFVWADANSPLDIYYGPQKDRKARLRIQASQRPFVALGHLEPESLIEHEGTPFLHFGDRRQAPVRIQPDTVEFSNDIVFASYWLLTGAREPHYPRDRWDNLDMEGSFFVRHALAEKPLVSLYGVMLRRQLERWGCAALPFPAARSFIFSHDVDYPQMIRWIECLRLALARGFKALPSIAGVLRGANHFWKFADWVEWERTLGARPAFYFMARRGSLPQYALGTPDAFYEIATPAFGRLFEYLRGEGCEIGLHASYHAHRSADQLKHEKERLEGLSGVSVKGNRHHYWHLDPAAPHETLRRHEEAGFTYDSSLGLEFYPGFRRGICHPFRPYHPGERRELNVVQLPPAWMDDHFDRRLEKNRINNPEACAAGLLDVARDTGGIAVLDYHARGMNADFYPRYGPWLMRFLETHLDSAFSCRTPSEVAQAWLEYDQCLERRSRDLATADPPVEVAARGPVSVDVLRAGEQERWEAFVAAHPHATIYHTLAWGDVTREGLGHQPLYLRAMDTAGEFTGVLPLFLVSGVTGRRLVSVPMRDRGGLLVSNRESGVHLIERAIELTRKHDCAYLELRSFHEPDPSVVRQFGLRVERNWITTRIDLSPGVEQLWKALDHDAVRWAIKKAAKQGVTFEFDNTQHGAGIFHDLFVRTRCSMGIPPFPKALFAAIWRHLISQGKASLGIVRKDGEPINAMISLHSGESFIPAYAAPQNAWRKLYPSEVMIWHTIEWAAQQGFRYYDFGADSPRQSGLLKFKRKWGGVQHPMYYSYFLNTAAAPPDFDSSSPAYTLLRKAWTVMPVGVAKPVGSWVTRQLS